MIMYAMEFRLKKCGILTLKRGNVKRSEGITLPDDRKMKSVEDEGYKYLAILQCDDLLLKHIKRNVEKEYFRRLKKMQ